MPSSDQLGVQAPLSLPIQGYINRINWTVARTTARAHVWGDLYLLAVPLDGANTNNWILVYSISLGTWQGIWELDSSPKTFSKDPTNPVVTYFLVGMANGVLAQWTYPQQRQYYDLELDGTTRRLYKSDLTTRSFAFGDEFAMDNPYNGSFTFLESVDQCTITPILDRAFSSAKTVTTTAWPTTNLTIPQLPFDLSGIGYVVQAIALQRLGLLNELQFLMEGTGNWTLAKIVCSAFLVRAQPNV
jgi:hypothetical protein